MCNDVFSFFSFFFHLSFLFTKFYSKKKKCFFFLQYWKAQVEINFSMLSMVRQSVLQIKKKKEYAIGFSSILKMDLHIFNIICLIFLIFFFFLTLIQVEQKKVLLYRLIFINILLIGCRDIVAANKYTQIFRVLAFNCRSVDFLTAYYCFSLNK